MLRGIEQHLESSHVSRVIYGAIIGMALVVGLEQHPPAPGAVVGTLVATGLAVGFAEFYSDLVGTKTRLHARLERHHYRHVGEDVLAVFFGVAFPSIFFILAAFDVIQVERAFTVAKWSGLALIAGYGYAAGRLSGAPWPTAVLHALGVAAIGAALIAFKALVH